VCDSDLLTADDFLGQASVDLEQYPRLYTHSEPVEAELPLQERMYSLTDHNGRQIRMEMKSFRITGRVTVRIQLCPPAASICGNLERLGRVRNLQPVGYLVEVAFLRFSQCALIACLFCTAQIHGDNPPVETTVHGSRR
jgi:hypothetical protein